MNPSRVRPPRQAYQRNKVSHNQIGSWWTVCAGKYRTRCRKESLTGVGIRRTNGSVPFSPVGQLAALHQLGPNDVPADAEQPRRLNLVAMTELIRCFRDGYLDLRV